MDIVLIILGGDMSFDWIDRMHHPSFARSSDFVCRNDTVTFDRSCAVFGHAACSLVGTGCTDAHTRLCNTDVGKSL